MADELLVGEPPGASAYYSSTNRFRLHRFLAMSSGVATSIHISAKVLDEYPAYAKAAIYSDVADYPDTLLAAAPSQLLVHGDNAISISPININAGVYYWLAYNTKCTIPVLYIHAVGTTLNRTENYDAFSFPNPAGIGFNSGSYTPVISAWGALAAGGAGRLIGSGDPSMIHVGHPKMIHVANPSLIRARGG